MVIKKIKRGNTLFVPSPRKFIKTEPDEMHREMWDDERRLYDKPSFKKCYDFK
jgi:hypothetical protein